MWKKKCDVAGVIFFAYIDDKVFSCLWGLLTSWFLWGKHLILQLREIFFCVCVSHSGLHDVTRFTSGDRRQMDGCYTLNVSPETQLHRTDLWCLCCWVNVGLTRVSPAGWTSPGPGSSSRPPVTEPARQPGRCRSRSPAAGGAPTRLTSPSR